MDERSDRGEFYPGGNGRGGVPPGTSTDKVDRVNLGELGESYTLKEVKAKVNQIVRAIAPAAVCLAICASAATAPLEDIPNTAPVVTNEEDTVAMAAVGALGGAVSNKVDVEVAGVHARIDSATNALELAGKAAILATTNEIAATYAKLADIPAQPDLSPYALKSELPQDYLVENDITNFATRAWIASQGYATGAGMTARLDAQDLAIDAATNAQNAAIAATGNRVTAATNRLWQAVGSESNRLDSATNEVWQSALRADETLQREIDALRIVAADSNAVTRLVTQDGTIWQDATGVVWQVQQYTVWTGRLASASREYTSENWLFTNEVANANVWKEASGTAHKIAWENMSGCWTLYENEGTIQECYFPGDTNYLEFAQCIQVHPQWVGDLLLWRVDGARTNVIDRILYERSTVARALTYGTPTSWTDATGCVWEVEYTRICTSMNEEWTYTMDGQTYTREQMIEAAGGDEGYSKVLSWLDGSFVNKDNENEEFEGWYVYDGSGTAPVGYDYETGIIPSYASDPYLTQVTYYGNITATRGELVPITNLVGRVALTNDIPEIDTSEFASHLDATNAAKSVATPISNLVETVRAEASLVYRLYQGSNVVAEVTNYNSQVHAPELRIMQLNESNEYITVWAETNGLARTLVSAKEYTDGATGAVARAAAPRAWSRTTSGLGEDAPGNTTWISTEKLVIASGLEYVHIDSAGVWILCANGQVDFSTPTNSFFSISTDSGENVFSVERTDSVPIPVYSDGIRIASSGGNKIVTIPVPVVDATGNADQPPFLNVALDLDGPWYSETNGIPSTVVSSCTWSGRNGAWTNTVVLSASHPSAFFNYSKWQAGGTVIRNRAAIDASGGILCTDGIHKCRPVYNNGTITWEAVQ